MSGIQWYSEGIELLREIVNYKKIPPEILHFWDNLLQPDTGLEKWNVISALNDMAESKKPKNIDLMAWYEILRDIFIMRAREQESLTLPVKTPLFTTFDRTFEQLAFLPDFWFNMQGDGKTASPPFDLLYSFERYMYNQEGGACWSALDWGMDKYCFLGVCGPAGRPADPEQPMYRIASLLLTAQFIANGKMGLYVGGKCAVNLPYAGIANDGQPDASFLKYYHYDRFTKMSFIRKRELELDADKQSKRAKLEPQWQSLAAMTEFILLSNSARATRTTCTRVGLNTFIRALNMLRGNNCLGDDPRILKAIELIDGPGFAAIPPEKLIREIGVNFNFIPCDYYLTKQGIDSAEKFWNLAGETFKAIQFSYARAYDKICGKSDAKDFVRRSGAGIREDAVFLKNALECDLLAEVCGRLTGARLRSAVKTLLVQELFEMNCGQMAQMLDKDFSDETVSLYVSAKGNEFALPKAWLVTDGSDNSETLHDWCCEILADFFRNPKTGAIFRDFKKEERDSVRKSADCLWNKYFNPDTEGVCRDRWMVSLAASIELLKSGQTKYKSLNLPENAEERERLLENNTRELEELSGKQPFDLEAVKKRLAMYKDGYSILKVSAKNKNLVILDLISRLMAATADVPPFDEMWNNFDELKVFFTHLLCATDSKVNLPFPFHVGVYSDSLHLSRNGNIDQRDHIDRLLRHDYDNAGERYVFQLMLLKSLKRMDDPQSVLDAVAANPAMAAFASFERLNRLKAFL